MQLIDNSNSVYRKGNLIIIAVVYIFSDLIFQGKLSEQFNSFLLNLQHWIITEIFKFRVCFDQQPFHEIFKFVKKSCHDDLNLSFQLPLYVESNSRLLRFFFTTTLSDWQKRKKLGSLCYPIGSQRTRTIFPGIRFGNMSILTLSFDWFSGRLCPLWFTLVLLWQHSTDNQSMDIYAYLFLC